MIVRKITLVALTVLLFVISGCGGSRGSNPDQRLEMIDLINEERAANGLPALTHNLDLSQVAQNYAQDMVVRNFLGHIDPDGHDFAWRVYNAGITFSGIGENVAAGFPTMETTHDAFMNSEDHRENILQPLAEQVGVGYMNGTLLNTYGNKLYVCVLFMQP